MTEITTTVNGRPALARLTHYYPAIPARDYGHPDDRHPGEPAEIEFELLTREGRPDSQLDYALTEADAQRIEADLLAAIRAERDEAAA